MDKIPVELTPYLDLLNNTGGNDPQNLLDRLNNEDRLMHTNVVVAVLASMCQAQLTLLLRLKEEGLLRERHEEVVSG